ncbi:MAG: glutamate synthase large subunit [Holosporales bacterium]|jgi:glutamate synthase (NADPH/NADH) large chain
MPHALYHQSEHDACGVGAVVALSQVPRRDVVEKGLQALANLMHRGAVGADGKTGDGAGLRLELNPAFFHGLASRFGGFDPARHRLAVAMVFLPRKNLEEQEFCRTVMESEIAAAGLHALGWRQVPINTQMLGEKAAENRPEIEQFFLTIPIEMPPDQAERVLYAARRRMEKRLLAAGNRDFYICSLSSGSIVYKGMMLADQMAAFYPDLANPACAARWVIFHQRYSTNTFPTWRLAHPFRIIAHNGEINTLKGNVAWMQAHEERLASSVYGELLADVLPIVQPGNSDSASLDNVLELLVHGGRPLPLAKALLIPEAWDEQDKAMPEALKSLYSYNNSVVEPWDGPAAVVGCDGEWLVAGMDRSGLRPCRYAHTRDTLVIGSEAGIVPLPDGEIIAQGRLGPGGMLAVHLPQCRVYDDGALKQWLTQQWQATLTTKHLPQQPPSAHPIDNLLSRQIAVGWSLEDLELILHPMGAEAKEAIGSMGDDSPLAVLAEGYRGMQYFFRQNFAQVTNPPLDSLREARVMSLKTRIGNLQNLLALEPTPQSVIELDSPIVLSADVQELVSTIHPTVIETLFSQADRLEDALLALCRAADAAISGGASALLLSDKNQNATRMAIPPVLAVSAVHSHLIRTRQRAKVALLVEAGACLDGHHAALLIACGATTVTPYLAEASLNDRLERGLCPPDALRNYQKALGDGLLKIMAKLGISVVASYRGGYNIEAIGLSRAVVEHYFPGVPSRLSGIDLATIAGGIIKLHAQAWHPQEGVTRLPVGGFYRARRDQGAHAWEGEGVHLLQTAVTENDPKLFEKYLQKLHARPPLQIRDLLEPLPAATPLPVADVEPVTSIRQRFVTPGMSLGALSPEAHGVLNIAMNRIGAKSDSGEGGEIPERYSRLPSGDSANSSIKQVASGRFGVTIEYLNQAEELEIKIAQGAKPGEGGQLPGFKVTELIARLRHATPGVSLISPPPHHDIYSIEDLAQLIYDLKQAAPRARVGVKLVARSGIGAIAAGVAKAGADAILVSGHNGGTGASPQSSIKFAGIPWEIGLAEVHQTLILNDLRRNVILRTDGGLRSGRDIVLAALLGAEEYGIGTAALVAMGCLIVRQCHANTCPVGVCTQDPKLREKFGGSAEKVINLMTFLAEDVRRHLAILGASSLDVIVGKAELIRWRTGVPAGLHGLDVNPLLMQLPEAHERQGVSWRVKKAGRVSVPDTLDSRILETHGEAIAAGGRLSLNDTISTRDRSVGARLSAFVYEKIGHKNLSDDHLRFDLNGTAGQSFGAFTTMGITLALRGVANDYVGKGLCGGIITIQPPADNNVVCPVLAGNTCLYGATSGAVYIAGQAGERFAVRNSGASAVTEGVGANALEYMTGGVAVILGGFSHNLAAGMTGGRAYIYDPEDKLDLFLNPSSVAVVGMNEDDRLILRNLLVQHHLRTVSLRAKKILQDGCNNFKMLLPKEILTLTGRKAA